MQQSKDKSLYSAFKAKDTRFDGRFFAGISSTGIYCRPVCKAKKPKIENCNFYPTAAAAEQAGYRPCLLCRPELAPGTAIVDASASLALRAARLLEENCGTGQSLDEIAGRLGYTDRHLRRVFTAEYNVSPVQYLQTCRLLLAKNLLTDTNLSVLDVAMAAGFGSLRRFNDLFKKQYRLSPTSLRKQAAGKENRDSDAAANIILALGYRPPYRWEQILRFLAQRAIPGIEVIKENEYLRTVKFFAKEKKKYLKGWIRVGNIPKKNTLKVTISPELLPALPQILAKVRQLFDLHCDPETIYEVLSPMNNMHPNLCVPGTRLPGCFDPFEMAIRAVLGQQITVKAASTLAARLVNTYGSPIQTGIDGLTHIFPLPENIIDLDTPIANNLGPLGITSARAKTILGLSKAFVQKEINFDQSADPEIEIKKLLALPGIGNWTARYIAMRAMSWPDAFLETDAGIKKALAPRTEKEMISMSEAWRPWRSYATINLWNSL